MEGFFTWQTLITYSGAALATTLITQLLKDIGPIKRLPARALSYFAALAVMISATVAVNGCDISELAIAPINAAVVSLASNGAFDAVSSSKAKEKKPESEKLPAEDEIEDPAEDH